LRFFRCFVIVNASINSVYECVVIIVIWLMIHIGFCSLMDLYHCLEVRWLCVMHEWQFNSTGFIIIVLIPSQVEQFVYHTLAYFPFLSFHMCSVVKASRKHHPSTLFSESVTYSTCAFGMADRG
jgi:hypothetical protein